MGQGEGRIQLEPLAQNTSGLFSYPATPGYTDSLLADLNRSWTPQELAGRFIGPPLFAPGTSWKSTNSGYLLAGMIAEAATGESLQDLYRTRVIEPLGLDGIGYLEADRNPPGRLAETWVGPAGGPFESWSAYDGPSFCTSRWPIGMLVMDARTMARWGFNLFGELLRQESLQAMLTAVPDDGGIPGQTGAGSGSAASGS